MTIIEMSHLQSLVSVAKTGSFSRAAEELGVTQSAISQSIKNFENKLGVSLFKRSGKKVIVTPEGARLCTMAQRMLLQLDDTITEIKNEKDKMSGDLRVGALSGVAKSWIYPELLKFSAEYPEVRVSFSMRPAHDLLADFEKFLLDCIIVPEDDVPAYGEKVFLQEEMLTLVFDRNSPLNHQEHFTLEDVAAMPVIGFEYGDILFNWWCQGCFGKTPKVVNRRLSVNSHGGILVAVSQGLGVAVLPTHVLARSGYRDVVATPPESFQVPFQKFYVVYHKESSEFQRVKKLIEALVRKREF